MSSTTFSVTINGISVCVRWDEPQSGSSDAPVIMLSNSLGTDLQMWDDQIEMLTQYFRVLRYDSRGHGYTDVVDCAYTIADLGQDALQLLDELHLEKVYFCGLSQGGMIGQWLACHAPERLLGLVLSNTSAYMAPADLWNHRIQLACEQGMDSLVDSMTKRWFTSQFIKTEPEKVARVQQMIRETPAAGYAACCAAIRDMDQREDIRTITVPTLVIAGAEDPATPVADAKLIAEAIPWARLSIIPNAAHLANIEQTKAYNHILLRFLTSLIIKNGTHNLA